MFLELACTPHLPGTCTAIHVFGTISSTSLYAKYLADRQAQHGTVVVATSQLKAYGRRGRMWVSPKGGLWFSVILRPRMQLAGSLFLPACAALSAGEALRSICHVGWGFRWPNDIVVQTRKICGILGESKIAGGKLDYAVLGIGLNANFTLRGLPEELRHTSTTIIRETGNEADLAKLLVTILMRLEAKIDVLAAGKHHDIVNELNAHDILLDRDLRLYTVRGLLRAKGRGLVNDGRLRVELANGELRVFDSGQVQRVELDRRV